MTDWSAQEKTLRARRAELTGEIAGIEEALEEPVPKDWEDAAVERQGDDVLQALGTHDAAELRRIDAALARIADGSYGICKTCGEDISAERLETLPDTPFCRNCAA